MKRRWLLCAACLPLIAAEFKEVPATSLDGQPARFATAGRITVVTFLSAQCPVSNDYNERMEKVYLDYKDRGVEFVFLNANANEPPAQVAAHARQAGFSFPVYKDARNTAADLFGAQATPESYVIDRAGALRYHGSIDDARNPARVKIHGLRDALDAVLAGGTVKVPEIKAFGCTIKRVKSN